MLGTGPLDGQCVYSGFVQSGVVSVNLCPILAVSSWRGWGQAALSSLGVSYVRLMTSDLTIRGKCGVLKGSFVFFFFP